MPALTTNQNAGFVTVPSENKIIWDMRASTRSISASERWMSQNSFLTRSLSDRNQMSTEPDCRSPIKERRTTVKSPLFLQPGRCGEMVVVESLLLVEVKLYRNCAYLMCFSFQSTFIRLKKNSFKITFGILRFVLQDSRQNKSISRAFKSP